MKVTKQGSFYVAQTANSAEGQAPRSAGFRWDPAKRVWWTKFIEKACKLAAYADATCQKELTDYAAQHDAAVEASRAETVADDVHIPAPKGLEYLPYQKAGISYASKRFAAGQRVWLCADDMGLGKTIQGVGLFNMNAAIRRVLVICPASLRINWKREFEKWAVRPVTVGIANGVFPDTDVVIINYDILEKFHVQIRAIQWDLMLVDEAQYLKNPKAKRTQEVLGSKKWDKVRKLEVVEVEPIKATYAAFLTGTPIVNRPVEAWPILHYADPTTWYNFMSFAKRYCGAKHNGYGWDFSGSSNLAELQDKLRSTIMTRRLKVDVLKELPAKRRQVIELPAVNGAKVALQAEQEAAAKYQKLQEELARLQAMGRQLGYEKEVA
jgi:SWI/SNF-related matrix-associated actin-dependent regulator 1 of chromatin subfamily A